MLNKLIRTLINLIYPPRCIACEVLLNAKIENICSSCMNRLHPLDAEFTTNELNKIYFDSAMSLYAYEGPIMNVIHKFKYSGRIDLTKTLSSLLVERLADSAKTYDYITAVPINRWRLFKRGYNQAGMLAKMISKKTNVHFLPTLLVKKMVKPQVGMDKNERMENVKGKINIRKMKKNIILEKNILLIDDVITTGATINECAKVLKKAGCANVDVLTIARTI